MWSRFHQKSRSGRKYAAEWGASSMRRELNHVWREPTLGRKQLMRPLADIAESAAPLDGLGEKVGKAVRGALGPGKLKDAISGTWLGHAVHPMLTDVVIGSFTSATLLDLLGGDDSGAGAERLIGIGIAAYGPTALTGVNDWADSEPVSDEVRRVGLVHASTNAVALTLYGSSLAARRRGDRRKGKVLSLAGAAVLATGGYLGGHLSFTRGVGSNQTAYDPGPDDWTRAIGPTSSPRTSRRPSWWTTRRCCSSATAARALRSTIAARTAAARSASRGARRRDDRMWLPRVALQPARRVRRARPRHRATARIRGTRE